MLMLSLKSGGLDAYDAAVEAARLRAEAILNKVSFVMETVLSTPEKLNLMREAKAKRVSCPFSLCYNAKLLY